VSQAAASRDADGGLNPQQLEAVYHLNGPCLVIAGAGSGKTRVITHKLQALLRSGYEPQQVAAITFTNKAAAEMRERAGQLIGSKAARAFVICTFHALGVRILREEAEAVGLKPSFSILDSDDQLALVRDAAGCSDNAVARRLQWAISGWKNAGMTPDEAEREARGHAAREELLQAARAYRRYGEQLAAYQSADFDDLILLPLRLFERDAAARARWRERLRYLLIDEYQDTNATQYRLLQQLAGEAGRFTAVGDDDQSIYGWRGATLDNIARLGRDYPTLKVVKLEQNYRSTGRILAAANRLIGANPKLYDKALWSALGEGEPVEVLACDDEEHEAERIVARIVADKSRDPRLALSDFAVLYRANHLSRPFEAALRRARLPYVVSGGQSFFERAEIRDVCAYLRLLANNDDDPAFIRAVTTPKRGIGAATLEKLGQQAGAWRLSLFAALFSDSCMAVLGARAAEPLREFGRLINDLEYRSRTEPAGALLLELLDAIAYERHLHDSADNDKQAAEKWRNVLDFADWIARRGEEDRLTLTQIAQQVALITQLQEQGQQRDAVTLSTIHAAKGLEWPCVYVVGCEEGTLPSYTDERPLSDTQLFEERRLMYVAITRAQRKLALSHAARRRGRGGGGRPQQASRFLAELRPGADPAGKTAAGAATPLAERLAKLKAKLQQSAAAQPD
jgi:ATP-dependent DNA helicase Rep